MAEETSWTEERLEKLKKLWDSGPVHFTNW